MALSERRLHHCPQLLDLVTGVALAAAVVAAAIIAVIAAVIAAAEHFSLFCFSFLFFQGSEKEILLLLRFW